MRALSPELGELPVYYFTQLLAVALGLADSLRLELNMDAAKSLLSSRALLGVA